MNEYLHNKRTKDSALCKLILKTINNDLKRNNLKVTDKVRSEFANELGTTKGTLENKLKPSMATNDMSITEFVHLLEITGDYEPLKYLNSMFDLIAVPKEISINCDAKKISMYVDDAQIESNDVFNAIKKAERDGVWTNEEKKNALKELQESDEANAQLRATLECIKVEDGN